MLVLAGAVLLATVFAGSTYSWCLLTQQVCPNPCAADRCDDTHEGEQGPAARSPCCEARMLGDLPPGAQQEAPPPVPAAPLAILPAAPPPVVPVFCELPAPLPARLIAQRAAPRAGPPVAAERCAVLQVFRC